VRSATRLDAEPANELCRLAASPVGVKRRELLALARRYGARNVRIFGSTARGEAGPDSDIDLLVDLEAGRTLLDLVALRHEASELLGRRVDVTTPDMLRDPVRGEAERDAVSV
jgi:predicted nucleotidyltransferase